MKTFTLILLAWLLPHLVPAQTDGSGKGSRIFVDLTTGLPSLDGELIDVNDSSIALKKQILQNKFFSDPEYSIVNVPVSQISAVKIRKRGSVGRGILTGALIGFGTGALIGLASGDDRPNPNAWLDIRFTAGEKALMTGTLLAVPGMIIGAIAGASAKISIPIGGSQEIYAKRRAELVPYTLHRK